MRKFCFYQAIVIVLLFLPVCTSPTNGPNSSNNSSNPDDDMLIPIWQAVFDTSESGALSSEWGSSPNDLFVVGGAPGRGEVYHFDGSQWEVMQIPNGPLLVWVFGFGPNDVFAVGEDGRAIRYDGTTWIELNTGTQEDLWGVWGSAADDLWVVGGTVGVGCPLILHFDGEAFTSVQVPENDRSATSLFKVWGMGSKIFAVGENGLILQFDDEQWFQVSAGAAADDDFVSLWGTSEENIVAVGGRTSARVAHYDGTAWTTQLFDEIPGLNGVFMAGADEAIVSGQNGYVGLFSPSSGELTMEMSGTNLCLHAVWGDNAGSYFAVGGRFTTPYEGVSLVRTLEQPGTEPGPIQIPVRFCTFSDVCRDGETCEDGSCVREPECIEDMNCLPNRMCADGACVAGPECEEDTDCDNGETCVEGQCMSENSSPCMSEPDCTLGERCNSGTCQEFSGPDIEYWAVNGTMYGSVEEEGITPVQRGFQGGVHTFVAIRAVGFPADAVGFLTIKIARTDNGQAAATERTLPFNFSEISPGLNEAQGIFVRLDGASPGDLIDVPAEISMIVTIQGDEATASLVQSVVLTEME